MNASRNGKFAGRVGPCAAPLLGCCPDASAAREREHAASAHDMWFCAQVAEAVKEADDPAAEWVSEKDARASWAKQRAALVKR